MDLAMGHNSFGNEVLMNCLERRVSKTILSRILYMIYSCKEFIIIIFVPIKIFYANREIRYLNLFMPNIVSQAGMRQRLWLTMFHRSKSSNLFVRGLDLLNFFQNLVYTKSTQNISYLYIFDNKFSVKYEILLSLKYKCKA